MSRAHDLFRCGFCLPSGLMYERFGVLLGVRVYYANYDGNLVKRSSCRGSAEATQDGDILATLRFMQLLPDTKMSLTYVSNRRDTQ